MSAARTSGRGGGVHGSVAPGFEAVAAAFDQAFLDAPGEPAMGAALAVRVAGETVVDMWAGDAGAAAAREWQPDTASVIFSCTKGIMAILAARLVQEGRLDYAAPVAQYWPEFAAAGKEHVRVSDLLAHRAGLSAPRVDFTRDDLLSWTRATSILAAQEPLWTPGAGYAYHAITHGWLIGEVIRRVTGMSPGAYASGLLARPLHADLWIGMPQEVADRVAQMRVGPSLQRLVDQQAAERDPEMIDWPDRAMTLGGVLPPELVGKAVGFNDARVRAAEIPGAGGISSARGLATVWSSTVTPTEGIRVLDDDTIATATRVQSDGEPVFPVPGPWPRWGMGFQLDSEARHYLGSESFGHDGAGGQVAFADSRWRVGFAFLTNRMEAIDDRRATRIIDALREVLTARG